MNASTLRTRCGRLLVLGAVVAGIGAAPAGAAESQPTRLGLIADGLRMQGIAHVYQVVTEQSPGAQTDDLRSKGAVPTYRQSVAIGYPAAASMPANPAQGHAVNRLVGNTWTRISPAEFRKLVTAFGSDVTTTMTPQKARVALARGQGLNQLAKRYADVTAPSSASSGSGFDWVAASIGVATATGAILLAMAGLITFRKQRRLVLPGSARIGD
jgi:hypothetical protein